MSIRYVKDTKNFPLFDKPRWTMSEGIMLFFALGILPVVMLNLLTSMDFIRLLGELVSPKAQQVLREIIATLSHIY